MAPIDALAIEGVIKEADKILLDPKFDFYDYYKNRGPQARRLIQEIRECRDSERITDKEYGIKVY